MHNHLWRRRYARPAEDREGRVRFPTSGQILTTMKSVLETFIEEAIADHMRFPNGPNSRDDAEDRSLDDPMDVDRINIEEGFVNEDSDTFFVRGELLDLEEEMQSALSVLDEHVSGADHDPVVNDALDALHNVARKLKQAAGLSSSRPPPIKR